MKSILFSCFCNNFNICNTCFDLVQEVGYTLMYPLLLPSPEARVDKPSYITTKMFIWEFLGGVQGKRRGWREAVMRLKGRGWGASRSWQTEVEGVGGEVLPGVGKTYFEKKKYLSCVFSQYAFMENQWRECPLAQSHSCDTSLLST